jgi:hypothetical protein
LVEIRDHGGQVLGVGHEAHDVGVVRPHEVQPADREVCNSAGAETKECPTTRRRAATRTSPTTPGEPAHRRPWLSGARVADSHTATGRQEVNMPDAKCAVTMDRETRLRV